MASPPQRRRNLSGESGELLMVAAPALLQSVKEPSPAAVLLRDVEIADIRIREGRFQTWLSLITGLSAALSGLEVAYEHWRGSYSRRVMYTPVLSSAVLTACGLLGFQKRWI